MGSCHGVSGGLKGIKKLQTWSVAQLKLEKEQSYHTVLRILRNETKVTAMMDSTGYMKRKSWCTRNFALDEQLRRWVIYMW